MTESDFWRICDAEDIEVVWSRKKYTFYLSDIRGIVLPDRLFGPRLLFAMFHELGHHFFHGGDDPCIAFQGLSDSKAEAEADAVALLALMPKSILSDLTSDDIEHIGPRYWKQRERLLYYDL